MPSNDRAYYVGSNVNKDLMRACYNMTPCFFFIYLPWWLITLSERLYFLGKRPNYIRLDDADLRKTPSEIYYVTLKMLKMVRILQGTNNGW